jgi:hypothetical protein
MSASTWFLIGMACAVPFALILLRANGDDTGEVVTVNPPLEFD